MSEAELTSSRTGARSVLAMRVAARIRAALNVDVPLAALFGGEPTAGEPASAGEDLLFELAGGAIAAAVDEVGLGVADRQPGRITRPVA